MGPPHEVKVDYYSLSAPFNNPRDEQQRRDWLQWLQQSRGISRETWEAAGLKLAFRYSQRQKRNVLMLAYPYTREGVVVNVKFRELPKGFCQTAAGEKIFYGYDEAQVGRVGAREGWLQEGAVLGKR
jgi:hypothetical protein